MSNADEEKSTLQALIDATPDGGTLTLPPRDYFGSVSLKRPITIDGRGPAVWIASRDNPVLRITSPGIILRGLTIEALRQGDLAIKADLNCPPQLDKVHLIGGTEGVPVSQLQSIPVVLAPAPPLHFPAAPPPPSAARVAPVPITGPPPLPQAQAAPVVMLPASQPQSGPAPASTGRKWGVAAFALLVGIAGAVMRYSQSTQPYVPPLPPPPVEPQPPPADPVVLCQPAHSAADRDPLKLALDAVDRKAPVPADNRYYDAAVRQASRATQLAPECAEAWAVLAYARYRAAYTVCGGGNYDEAEAAVRKALSLPAQVEVRASALRNLGRIQAARLRWAEAEALFKESLQAAPDSASARNWLAGLAVVQAPSTALVGAVSAALRGEELTAADIQELTVGELAFVIGAPSARFGRRMNEAAQDWLFFCNGSPVGDHPTIDPMCVRDPLRKGTVDWQNRLLATERRRQLRKGVDGSGVAKSGDVAFE